MRAYLGKCLLPDAPHVRRMVLYLGLCLLSNIIMGGEIMNQPNTRRKPEIGLLAVLVAIADTGTVSAAADQLSLSQPAVSHALRRLRDITGDRLFERSGRIMVPTVCAASLVEQARRVIDEANVILRAQTFDPRTGAPVWRISAPEYALWAFGIPLLRALRAINPAARVNFACAGPHTIDDLLASRIDLAFWGDPRDPRLGSQIVLSELCREHYIGVMCRSHPLAARSAANELDLETWLAWDHVMLTTQTPGRSIIDRTLMALGRSRSIGMASSSHRLNLECIKGSTWLLALPSRLMPVVDPDAHITFTLPLDSIGYPYFLMHHRHRGNDPALVFMRKLIGEVCDPTAASQVG